MKSIKTANEEIQIYGRPSAGTSNALIADLGVLNLAIQALTKHSNYDMHLSDDDSKMVELALRKINGA